LALSAKNKQVHQKKLLVKAAVRNLELEVRKKALTTE
jgi:hypothetical protein